MMEMTEQTLPFASDYMEGAHPHVLDALIRTNDHYTDGYGEDDYCRKAARSILKACECPDGAVHFLVGGTQANAVVIDALLKPYQGVIAAETGHVAVHEAGAIEYGGHKVLIANAHEGKLCAESIQAVADAYEHDENRDHMVMPGMVYLSQPTEYGTLYSLRELTEISRLCRRRGLILYVDGARLAYALASEANDVGLSDLARLCDVFYIGGTKCGLLFGEAVVLTAKDMTPHFVSIIKQHGALLAKGRLLGVQFDALFRDGLYAEIGKPAVRQAAKIRNKLLERGYRLAVDSPTNQLFVIVDDALLAALGKWVEYSFIRKMDDDHTVIRLTTSWSTTDEMTDCLLRVLERCGIG